MQQAIELLELGEVKAALRARTRTPLGADRARGLAPLDTAEAARARVEAVRQVRGLLDLAEPPPVDGAEDVGAALDLGEKGIALEGAQLRAIARTMEAGSALRQHLLAHEAEAPSIYGLVAGLADLRRTASEVLRCFDPDGQLADDASADLGPLRRRVRKLRASIHEKLDELIKSPKMEPLLQEAYYTIRQDRYVLPIKASFKNEVKGIVHDASGSGQTVFIEPQVLVDIGNALKIAQSEQAEEEHRILSRLTALVTREADEVRDMMAAIGEVDLLTGGARLADDLRARPVAPEEGPGFRLVNARHPLLVLQAHTAPPDDGAELPVWVDEPRFDVVGNDFGLEAGHRVLVVTGPNTGGKTVAMKTIGLFALMARCGLHLPCAEGSTMGWYADIEATIGDQQSIASNLSTFAAHVQAVVGILRRARPGALVLIDEIAADTDPTQGQALAQSILEALAEREAHAVVTTHFERLKAVPFVDDRFRNAGVGFDAERLVPTYRVSLDVPRGSSGLDIARKLGLPGDVVDRAKDLLGEGAQELQGLLAAMETRSATLERSQAEAEAAREAAERERVRFEQKQAEMEREIERVKLAARKDLLEDIAATREEVRRLIADLQKAQSAQPANEAMRRANQAADKLGKIEKAESEKVARAEPEAAGKKKLSGVHVGAWVHVPKLGRDGEVAAIDGKDAQVVVGNMRVRVPVKSLRAPAGRRPAKSKIKSTPPRSAARVEERAGPEGEKRSELVEEIDLRGHTVDESIDRLDAFLDYHYGQPTTLVRIVHGLGTGALRDGIRDYLRRSGYVREMRPGERKEGGDGVTFARLA
jgi:DNA mismatch repair protein MutS2